MPDFDKLTEGDFMGLLARIDRAEGALHVFRASLSGGCGGARDARIRYERAHNELACFVTRLRCEQIFRKGDAV